MRTQPPDLAQIARRVRDALDRYVALSPGLRSETRGLCVAASLALAAAIRERGLRPTVVRGRFDGTGHAWVEVGGRLLDVTADQFPGRPALLLASRATEPRYADVGVGDAGHDQFLRDMGPDGDDVPFTYLDADGEECPLGTTNEVAAAVLALYHDGAGRA